MTTIDLASSIVEIANENMASAIKMVSLERGYDPRRFALFGFGGAGPLHAAAVARSLRMPKVLVPIFPGNASALGMLLADLRVDKVWTQAFRSSRVDAALVARQFAGIREAAEAELRQEGFEGVPVVHCSISMRYAGQNYEHLVPVSAEPMTDERLQAAFAAFETIHAERYGYRIEGEEIELVAFHVTVTGRRPEPATGGAGRRRRERRGCDATGSFSGCRRAADIDLQALWTAAGDTSGRAGHPGGVWLDDAGRTGHERGGAAGRSAPHRHWSCLRWSMHKNSIRSR